MIAEQEAKEREMQQKKEEEKNLKETDENRHTHVTVRQEEITESINRVQEHFRQVTQLMVEEPQSSSRKRKKKKKNKNKNKNPVLLSQMQDRKRKRESNIAKRNENVEKSNDTFLTPTPSLDTRIVHVPKKAKLQMENMREEQRTQQSFAQPQRNNNANLNYSIR